MNRDHLRTLIDDARRETRRPARPGDDHRSPLERLAADAIRAARLAAAMHRAEAAARMASPIALRGGRLKAMTTNGEPPAPITPVSKIAQSSSGAEHATEESPR